ncbi:hypothetical protein OCS_06867 [Ophiocordyceps sinensis CO18]|uniref:Uncharacterized protein n=1 Tax=Ophiocordyceps sinensis (strain Co18 / CGMCC 3.14243) TaxID=911162 RepID=T5A6H8_OPHSC|nr:hypothetical protein OCS_06867 [Ophiocordyceps sinensis CO18]
MGNTASDLFYPDNPKRRERAQGLRQDILQYVQDFEREKAKKSSLPPQPPRCQADPRPRDEAFNVLKAELDEVLHRLGVQTRDELDEYIRVHIRHDADLKAYDGLRARCDAPEPVGVRLGFSRARR